MPKPAEQGGDAADTSAEQPDRTGEAVSEAVDEMEQVDSTEPASDDPFDGEEEVEVNLAETDIGREVDERMDELEEAERPNESSGDSSGDGPFDGDDTSLGGDYGADPSDFEPPDSVVDGELPDTINEGFARLAVIGLQDEFVVNGDTKTKEGLQTEFEEVFETFKLGDFGAEAAEEYLDIGGGDIDPIWGFTASLAISAVLVVQMRPDSDDIAASVKQTLGNIGGQL